MKRAEFLKNHWSRYPASREGLGLVSDYDPSVTEGWWAGTLKLVRANSLILCGDENQIEFSLAPESTILSQDRRMQFQWSWLRQGDQIAIEVKQGTVHTLELLAPNVSPERDFENEQHNVGDLESGNLFSPSTAREWQNFLRDIRTFFVSQKFVEVATPTLVPSPGTEPYIDFFRVEGASSSFYLPSSPEFHLKKILGRGFSRLFEITRCYRDEPSTDWHQSEFWMLEWYRAFASFEDIAHDLSQLLKHLGVATPLQRVRIDQLFKTYFQFTLHPSTTTAELIQLAEVNHIETSSSDTWDEVFFRLFLDRIEPRLKDFSLVILTHYPPSLAALARLDKEGWAERFEFYWNGIEIANAFHELNDPELNQQRFNDDALRKVALGKPSIPRDEKLIQSLQKGLPPSGGIALGLDRLFACLNGISDIAATRAFPRSTAQ